MYHNCASLWSRLLLHRFALVIIVFSRPLIPNDRLRGCRGRLKGCRGRFFLTL